jgi:glycosyltransferase involved in cell wall biosynthesis
MKILLSAYACEPNKGSEPGVGWNWALALARRGYEVHVLTRSNNREAIESTSNPSQSLLHFHFYDLPAWMRFWKRWPGGIYLYYLLWQVGVYRFAKRLHARERFELVQHITFVSHRQPSFMGGLGIPFIFGPVGGGETMPRQLRPSLPFRARVAEAMRDAGNRFVMVDPLMRRTYAEAQMIACATEETLFSIPARFRDKCIVQRAIGIDESVLLDLPIAYGESQASSTRFLFVGRMLYWKGLHLALQGMSRIKGQVPDVRLRVIGEGNDRDWLKRIAQRAGVADRVEWVSRVAFNEMSKEYHNSAALIFPSLHDSGGMVVLEAFAAALPVICLDLGGPGSMVDSTCGAVVPAVRQSEFEIIENLAAVMMHMSSDSEWRSRLAHGARERAREMSWDAAARVVYSAPLITKHLK